jgi:hypothetical protein
MNISDKIEEQYALKANSSITSRKDIADYWETPNIAVNVKSNNIKKNNFSPNLVSCKKIYDFLLNSKNQFKLIFVDYEIKDDEPHIIGDQTVFIEEIDWSCLSIQCQGTGVIQRSKPLIVRPKVSRAEWINEFRQQYADYIERQHEKLNELKGHFQLHRVQRRELFSNK